MFRSVIIASDAGFGTAVERFAINSEHLIVNKTLSSFPQSAYEVSRVISGYDPELVMLENTIPERALTTAKELKASAPEVALLAVGERVSPTIEQQFQAVGASVLCAPFSPEEFVAAVKQAIHGARRSGFGHLYAFLPGKAGSGATTVALNVAMSMAGALQKKVFVLEADLHSGVMSTLLGVKPRVPLIDVLNKADSLDYSTWMNAIVQANGVDFLLADRVKKTPLPSWMDYHQLLRFASKRYQVLVVDLPEVVNEATAEIVQYARCTFVVCTPELASLKLAEQRLQELAVKNTPADAMKVVLNRWHKSDMKAEDVAELLRRPVYYVIRNDYRSVNRAINGSRAVEPNTEVGRELMEFSKKLVLGETAAQPARSKFSFF